MNRRPLVRTLLASAAILAAAALAGCNTDGTTNIPSKALKPLSEKMISEIEQKSMDKDSAILLRVFKQESELEVWKKDRSGRFALLKTYPICRWSGELGPKIKEGDRQAPEGFYNITPGQMNPNSQYYLSFDLGYPNAFDRAHGRTGAQLMVHGDCSSRGCYSMTDEQISEIYALGRGVKYQVALGIRRLRGIEHILLLAEIDFRLLPRHLEMIPALLDHFPERHVRIVAMLGHVQRRHLERIGLQLERARAAEEGFAPQRIEFRNLLVGHGVAAARRAVAMHHQLRAGVAERLVVGVGIAGIE